MASSLRKAKNKFWLLLKIISCNRFSVNFITDCSQQLACISFIWLGTSLQLYRLAAQLTLDWWIYILYYQVLNNVLESDTFSMVVQSPLLCTVASFDVNSESHIKKEKKKKCKAVWAVGILQCRLNALKLTVKKKEHWIKYLMYLTME